jgi:N-acyl homoserine lactone hydrolase
MPSIFPAPATRRVAAFTAALALSGIVGSHSTAAGQARPPSVKSPRLYIFPLGNLPVDDTSKMFREPLPVAKGGCCIVVAHLIVHPKGTLLWDTGVVPDAQLGSGAPGTEMGGKRSLKDQLAEIGYSAKDITYLALSHFHFDHTGNANDYQGSTWIVQQPEREAMFAGKPLPAGNAAHFTALKNSKTIVLSNIDEYDVFGDGTVVIKVAAGHTPGHQVLVLKLPKTGPVMLAGDLYHFREERAAKLVPTIDTDAEQTRAARIAIEDYVQKNKMPLWIEHDTRLYDTLKKSPGYVE